MKRTNLSVKPKIAIINNKKGNHTNVLLGINFDN